MKNKFIKALALSVLIVAMTASVASAVHSEVTRYDWYCKRCEGNVQPSVEPNMSFIENYDAYYVNKNVTDDDKVIYLTFDAGYENGNIAKTLDILKAHDAKGAFFILDNLIIRNTELVIRMAQEGHLVCNHTKNHPDMTKLTDKEKFASQLTGIENVYKDYTGLEMAKYYRPPEGKFSEQNLKYAEELGFVTVFWSFAYADWNNNKQPDCDESLAKILKYSHNGEIMLLHPTSATNAAILDRLLGELKSRGYRFGSLDELCRKSNG